MKGDVIAEDGSGVCYDKLKHSAVFEQYKKDACALRDVDLSCLNHNQTMAFFISILCWFDISNNWMTHIL